MQPFLLEVLDSPIFGIILFVLFFGLAALVVGLGWSIIYLCKLMSRRWNEPFDVEANATTASRVGSLLLLVPIAFLLAATVLVINKAASFWAGLSQ